MKHALTALAAGLALTAPAFAQDAPTARFDWFAYEGADPEHAAVQPGTPSNS